MVVCGRVGQTALDCAPVDRSGDQSGVEGTPALYLNGFAYDGNVSVEALEETIERALSAARTR